MYKNKENINNNFRWNRMRRKRRKNKQIKLITLTSLSLLFILTVGYAAFSTNLNINAKGNIKEITSEFIKNKYCNQTSGDGLYKDIYEESRCIYKGTNPNNYITLNNELWRIISIENDNTLKLIKQDSIGAIEFDKIGYRNATTSTYCSNAATAGCNIWAIDDNCYDLGTVTQNSSINDYLNTTYYNSLNDLDKKHLINSTFKVGRIFLGNDSYNLQYYNDFAKEKLWTGKIALLTVNEYVTASLDTNCKTPYNLSLDNNTCKNQNYLYQNYNWWTLNATSITMRSWIWEIDKDGKTQASNASIKSNIRPVFYIKSDITLSGEGTEKNPYTIN